MKKVKYIEKLKPYLKKEYENYRIIIKRIYERYNEIVDENYEIEEMYIHTHERIYPGIATFQVLLECGKSREEAEVFVNEYLNKSVKRNLQILMKIPGLYRMTNIIFKRMVKRKYKEKLGFYIKWYETQKNELRFDVIECPYNEICTHYHCQEIVKGYCDSNEICYKKKDKKISWFRTQTLEQGDECCDFRIIINKKV